MARFVWRRGDSAMTTPSSPVPNWEFNPTAPHMCVDPYPDYKRLRETSPVYYSQNLQAWIVMTYQDVAVFLGENQRLQMQYANSQIARLGEKVVDEPYFQTLRHMMIGMDGAEHARIRMLFSNAFTPKRVNGLRSAITRGADDLIDRMLKQKSADLVADFCFEFPVRVIGDMLGIPPEDHQLIGDLAYKVQPVLEWLPMDAATLARVNDSAIQLRDYFTELQARRRRNPGDDLFSTLVALADQDGGISDAELIANSIHVYIAGHETTAGAISLGMLALHRNPEQLALLKSKPELISNAVLEMLRYDASGQATARVVMNDMHFGDATIPAGSVLVGYIASANRDPAVYPDPDRLDVTRKPDVRLLNFGGGVHACIGNVLARMELEIAFAQLLARLPNLRLETLDPQFRDTALLRGVKSMPVSW
jgi:cytochrome P450